MLPSGGLKKVIDEVTLHNEAHTHLAFSQKILLPGVVKGKNIYTAKMPCCAAFPNISYHIWRCSFIWEGSYFHDVYLTASQEKANVMVLQASTRLPHLTSTPWECQTRFNHRGDHRPHWEPEIDGLAPLHVHCRPLGNMNWVPTALGAGEMEADKQTGNQEHRPNLHPLQGSAEGSGSGGQGTRWEQSNQTQPRCKETSGASLRPPLGGGCHWRLFQLFHSN